MDLQKMQFNEVVRHHFPTFFEVFEVSPTFHNLSITMHFLCNNGCCITRVLLCVKKKQFYTLKETHHLRMPYTQMLSAHRENCDWFYHPCKSILCVRVRYASYFAHLKWRRGIILKNSTIVWSLYDTSNLIHILSYICRRELSIMSKMVYNWL